MAKPDFRNYLLSLTDPSSQDWGDRYTPTQAELPLKVQTIVPRPDDPIQQQQEAPKRYEVLAGLRKYAADHVLLVGKPGSGKSTALRRLLWEEAQIALEAIEQGRTDFTIPVLIELRDRREGTVINWIQKALRRSRISQEVVDELLLDGRFLLLFDGLNEIPASEVWLALDEFQRDRDFHANPCIFTARELGAGSDLGIEKKLEMLPLTDPQMREFIENRLPGQADNLLRQLKDRLRELAETPLLLTMLCDVVQESPDGELPQNRGELFRQEFAQRYERFKPLRGRVSDRLRLLTPKLLQHLAFVMTQGDPHSDPCKPTPSWLSIPKSRAATILATFLTNGETYSIDAEVEMMTWLEAMLSHYLLQLSVNPDEIEFRHQLFQEYYAAEKLLELLPTLSNDELKQDYLNYLKWTEAIALMLGLLDGVKALKIVQASLEVDLQLGARLVGKVKKEEQKTSIKLLDEYKFGDGQNIQAEIKIELLAKSQSHEVIPYLMRIIEDKPHDYGWNAVKALGQISSDEVIPVLRNLLPRTQDSISSAVIDTLREIGSEKTLPLLDEALSHPNEAIRCEATDVVSSFRSKQVIPILLKALRDNCEGVRKRAIAGLGKLRSKEVFNALIMCIWDEDYEARNTAFHIIEESNLKPIIPHLQKVVDDPWLSVWHKKEAEQLLERLKHGNNFQDKEQPNILLERGFQPNPILSKSDFLEFWNSLDLSDFKTCEQVEKIAENFKRMSVHKLVRDSYSNLEIANRVKRIVDRKISREAIPALLEVLDGGSPDERKSASLVLSKIGLEAAIPSLTKALKNWFHATRHKAAVLLGELKAEDSVAALTEVLQVDENDVVLMYTAEALGKIGSEAAVPMLIEILRYNNRAVRYKAVRWSAAKALGDIASKEAILGLIKAGRTGIIPGIDIVQIIESIEKDSVVCALPHYLKMISSATDTSILRAIAVIQGRCKFYNYEIAQAAAEERKRGKGERDGNEKDSTYSINAEVVQIIEKNDGTVIGQSLPKTE